MVVVIILIVLLCLLSYFAFPPLFFLAPSLCVHSIFIVVVVNVYAPSFAKRHYLVLLFRFNEFIKKYVYWKSTNNMRAEHNTSVNSSYLCFASMHYKTWTQTKRKKQINNQSKYFFYFGLLNMIVSIIICVAFVVHWDSKSWNSNCSFCIFCFRSTRNRIHCNYLCLHHNTAINRYEYFSHAFVYQRFNVLSVNICHLQLFVSNSLIK